MIVGTKAIDSTALLEACKDIVTLERFAVSLVPRAFRGIDGILDNQKYLVALMVRELRLPFKKKEELTNSLLRDIRLRGTTTVITIEDILSNVDYDRLLELLFKEEL